MYVLLGKTGGKGIEEFGIRAIRAFLKGLHRG
jgi:hypothetical protein